MTAAKLDVEESSSRSLRMREALSPGTTSGRLAELASDPSTHVRIAVAMSPFAPMDHLGELELQSVEMRTWVERNPQVRSLIEQCDSPAGLADLATHKLRSVRAAVASHPNSPESVIVGLIEDPDRTVRRNARGHRVFAELLAESASDRTSPERLNWLARIPEVSLRAAVAGNPRLEEPAQLELAALGSKSVSAKLVRNPAVSGRALAELAKSGDEALKVEIARSSAVWPETLNALSAGPSIEADLAVAIAESPAAGLETLVRIVRVANAEALHIIDAGKGGKRLVGFIREGVYGSNELVSLISAELPSLSSAIVETQFENDLASVLVAKCLPKTLLEFASMGRCPTALLSALANHGDPRIRAKVGSNSNTADATLQTLAFDASPDVREAVAGNPSTSDACRLAFCKDPNPRVRKAILSVAPKPVMINILALDPDPAVRLEAAKSPLAPRKALAALSRFADDEVRDAILANPAAPDSLRRKILEWQAEPFDWPTSGKNAPPRALLVGTFGAGKSSLMRQLLGTASEEQSFPATGPGKTTIARTEILCLPERRYQARAEFMTRKEFLKVVRDNLVEACKKAVKGDTDRAIANRLLVHRNERIRLSFLLGRFDHRNPEANEAVSDLVSAVKSWAAMTSVTPARLAGSRSHGRQPIVRSEGFSELEGALIQAVLLKVSEYSGGGDLRWDDFRWPVSWTFTSNSRKNFLSEVGVLAGNEAVGSLLTPLVKRLQVRGPFKPSWSGRVTPLLLVDSEGLGHAMSDLDGSNVTPGTSQQMRRSDSVVLVDVSTGGMLGKSSRDILVEVVEQGKVSALHVVFTRLDQVLGQPGSGHLDDPEDAKDKVFGSVHQLVDGLSGEPKIGRAKANALADRITANSTFAYSLQDLPHPDEDPFETREHLQHLHAALSGRR